MITNVIRVRILEEIDTTDNSVNLVVKPIIPMFGHTTDHSPFIVHNETSHTILVWASATENGPGNESSVHIGGWQELVGHGGEMTLSSGQYTADGQLTIIEQNNRFWVNAEVKTGGLGGGLSASEEIMVEPT